MALQNKELKILASNGNHYYTLKVVEESISNVNNTSTISWSFTLSCKNENYNWYSWGNKISYSVSINGASVATGTIPNYDGVSTVVLASGSNLPITHNNNGSKAISIGFNVSSPTYPNYLSGTAKSDDTFTLTNIPRYAEILTAPNFNDEENPTITYSNPLGNSMGTLEACIANSTGGTVYVQYKSLTKTNSSYTFNLTDAERAVLRRAATKETLDIRFFIRCKITNNEEYTYSSLPRVLTIINAKPTLVPTAKVKDTVLTGSTNKAIKGISDIDFAFNATAQKEATIVSYSVECGSKKGSAASGTLYDIESNTVKFTIEDSRGNVLTKNITLTLVDYVGLTCNQTATIELVGETGAKINLTVSGNYFNSSLGATANTLQLQYRIKADGGSYGNWINITSISYSGNTYKGTYTITGLSYDKSFVVQCRATDKITTINSVEYPINLTPIFDWGKSDFKFNVPVYIQGDEVNDFVIATGTEAMGSNGTWYWRKWKSGRAECYGKRNYGNMGVSTAWGSWFESATFSQTLPSGLFAAAPDVVEANIVSAGGAGFITFFNAGLSATNTGSFTVCRPTSMTLSQVYIGFNVIGRWK